MVQQALWQKLFLPGKYWDEGVSCDSRTVGASVTSPAIGRMHWTLSEGEVTLMWETCIGRFDNSFFGKLTTFLWASVKSSSLLSCNRQRHDPCPALFVSRERRVCSQCHCKDHPEHCIPRSKQCEPYLEWPDKEDAATIVKVLRFLVRRWALKDGDKKWLVFIEQSQALTLLLLRL